MSHEYEIREEQERLADLLRLVLTRWVDVRARWNDPVSNRFEQEHVQEIERMTRQYLSELQDTIRLVAKGTRLLNE